jgi:recombination protein RecA
MGRNKKLTEAEVEVIDKPKKNNKKEIDSNRTSTSLMLKKKFGDNLIITADKIAQKELEVISLSPAFDRALNGGIKTGQMVVVSGESKVGKTFMCLHFAANAQRAGKKVVFISAEGRLEPRDVGGKGDGNTIRPINGLITEEVEIVGSFYGKTLTCEDYLFCIEQYLINETDLVLIVDSLSILAEEKEITNDLTQQTMGGISKILGRFTRRMAPIISTQNHILIFIAQRYDSFAPQGKKKIVKIPNCVRYALSTFIEFDWIEKIFLGDKEDSNQIGIKAHVNINCSPLGPPNAKLTSYLRFDYGIDDIQEMIESGKDLGIIDKKAAWFEFNGVNLNGNEKLRQHFIDNSDQYEELKKQIKEMLE